MADADEPEPTTWFGKQKAQVKKDAVNFKLHDCPECRYVGGSFLIFVGGYVGYVGHRRAAMKGGGVMARLPSAIAAGLMMSLGIMRLSGSNPFSEDEVGIDFLRKLFSKKTDSGDSSTAT